jgi:VanZ family protein
MTTEVTKPYLYPMKSTLYKLIFWLGYAATFVVSCIPLAGDLSKIRVLSFQLRLDQLLHFIVYLLIMLFYLFGMRRGLQIFKNHSLLKFFAAIFALATITETIQLLVPARTFNVFDMVANIAGLLTGTAVILFGGRREGARERGSGEWRA